VDGAKALATARKLFADAARDNLGNGGTHALQVSVINAHY
jgi:hypothetical protein